MNGVIRYLLHWRKICDVSLITDWYIWWAVWWCCALRRLLFLMFLVEFSWTGGWQQFKTNTRVINDFKEFKKKLLKTNWYFTLLQNRFIELNNQVSSININIVCTRVIIIIRRSKKRIMSISLSDVRFNLVIYYIFEK